MSENAKQYTIISEQSAADFLLKSEHCNYLYPFMEQEQTLSDVAEILDLNLSSLYHHVKKMLAFGLIKETGSTLRNKKKAKLYKAVDEAFVVPLTATSSSTLESHLQEKAMKDANEMGRFFAQSLTGIAEEWGFYIALGDKGLSKIVVPKRRGENAELKEFYPTIWSTTTYFLDDDDTVDFASELEALYVKYKQKSIENDGVGNAQKVVLFVAPE